MIEPIVGIIGAALYLLGFATCAICGSIDVIGEQCQHCKSKI